MKKLLVTVIGATAAIGAFAYTNTVRFTETAASPDADALNAAARVWNNNAQTGTYVSEYNDATKTNEYSIGTLTGTLPTARYMDGAPDKELSVKTRFGKPLEFRVDPANSSKDIGSGLYFDSLVKFTVCDGDPEDQAAYNGAKIMMWLQETDTQPAETNLYVKAGYIWNNSGTLAVSNFTYQCANEIDGAFADKWHRVTIKAIEDITLSGEDGAVVPGFAIFIDGDQTGSFAVSTASSTDKWYGNFTTTYTLTETATHLNSEVDAGGALFPSMVLGGTAGATAISSASFDGTGWVNDIAFTDVAPFEEAEDYVAPKASVEKNGTAIAGSPFADLAAAIDAIEAAGSGTYTIALIKDVELADKLTINSVAGVNIVLDFSGMVITYAGSDAAIVNNGNLTITDSSGTKTGGIRCTDAGAALVQGADAKLNIEAGNFWGDVDLSEALDVVVSGGSYNDDTIFESEEAATGTWLAPGKKVVPAATWTELNPWYDVVPATYTITFISGEGSATNKYENCTYEQVINVPTPAVVVGKTFSAWSPAIDGATVIATADATYTAVYEAVKVNVIFVDGDTATTNEVDYGTTLTAESAPAFVGRTGYTAAWDKTVAGTTVTAETTFTAVYTGKTFTINTYVIDTVGVNATTNFTYAGESVDPAAPDFDAEDKTWDGKWYTGSDKAAEFAFDPDGETTQSAWVELTDKGGELPNIPAGGEAECGTAEAAADAADAINKDAASKAAHIAIPAGVSDTTTYLTYVEAKAEGTKVKVDFSDDGAAVAQTSANNDVVSEAVSAAVAAAAAAGAEGSSTASVSTVAGFYYSIVSGTSPTAVTTEGDRVLGTGGSVNLTVPNKGPAGFYKVKVSARAAD